MDFLTAWQWDPLLWAPLLAMAAAYLLGSRRLAGRHRAPGVARGRAAFFWSGWLVLLVALVSPLHELGEQRFSIHMTQHLLLSLVAPPLLLLSNSMPVMLWALPRQDRATVGGWLGQPGPVHSLLRLLTNPFVAWWLFVLTQWLWHQPGPYELALADHWAHYAEHLTFFGSSVLFWWPVVGAAPLPSPLSMPARLLYAFLAWIPNSILGAGITLSPHVLYPFYEVQGAALGFDPLADQQLAGLIMWIPGDIVFVSILLVLFGAILSSEERLAERLDRELDARETAGRATR